MSIRTVIVDDHPLIREGLKKLLESSPDICVAAEAENGAEALDRIFEVQPDVVVLDMSMPVLNGRGVLKHLKQQKSHPPVLVFSMHEDKHYIIQVLKEGASGYLTKDASADELFKALRTVAAGRRYIDEHLAEEITHFIADNGWKYPVETLSPRERSVLSYISSGMSARQIARVMKLSIKTINTYRSKICSKLHLRTSTELVQFALSREKGL